MSGKIIAALDIGGTNIKACRFTPQGELIDFCETPSEAKNGAQHLLARGAQVLRELGAFDGIGISTAGQVDPQTGVIRYANDNIPGYTGVDVRAYFAGLFSVPAAVRNDVCAAALGEGIQGAAKGASDYICLTYGTGVGGCLVLGGIPYYGSGYCAGPMLGGIVLEPCLTSLEDPFAGTYERLAAASALFAAAKQAEPSITSGRDLFSLLSKKCLSPPLQEVLQKWLDYVALGLCSIIHAYNVPLAVLGGGVMEQSWVVQEVARRVRSRLIPAFRETAVIPAALGNKAGLYGAAACLMQDARGCFSWFAATPP